MRAFFTKTIMGGVFAIAALSAVPAHAVVSVGLKGGIAYGQTVTDPATDGAGYGLGYLGGVGLKFGAGPIGFMVDGLYAIRKSTASASATVLGTTYTVDATTTTSSIYVPAQLNFGMGPIMLTAGGYYAMGIGNVSIKSTINGVGSTSSRTYAEAGLSSSDYGIVAGLGVKLGKLSIEGRYNFGLANLSKTDGVTANTRAVDVLLGFWF